MGTSNYTSKRKQIKKILKTNMYTLFKGGFIEKFSEFYVRIKRNYNFFY